MMDVVDVETARTKPHGPGTGKLHLPIIAPEKWMIGIRGKLRQLALDLFPDLCGKRLHGPDLAVEQQAARLGPLAQGLFERVMPGAVELLKISRARFYERFVCREAGGRLDPDRHDQPVVVCEPR